MANGIGNGWTATPDKKQLRLDVSGLDPAEATALQEKLSQKGVLPKGTLVFNDWSRITIDFSATMANGVSAGDIPRATQDVVTRTPDMIRAVRANFGGERLKVSFLLGDAHVERATVGSGVLLRPDGSVGSDGRVDAEERTRHWQDFKEDLRRIGIEPKVEVGTDGVESVRLSEEDIKSLTKNVRLDRNTRVALETAPKPPATQPEPPSPKSQTQIPDGPDSPPKPLDAKSGNPLDRLEVVKELEAKRLYLLKDPQTGKEYYAKIATAAEAETNVKAAQVKLPPDSPLAIPEALNTDVRKIPPALDGRVSLGQNQGISIIAAVPKGTALTSIGSYGSAGIRYPDWNHAPITADEMSRLLHSVRDMNQQGVRHHDLFTNTEILPRAVLKRHEAMPRTAPASA